jgi:hypothetical protein
MPRKANKEKFFKLLDKYSVSAIFSGHYHPNGDKSESIQTLNADPTVYPNGSIPEYNCGSAEWNRYLYASFKPDTMTVKVMDGSDGSSNIVKTFDAVPLKHPIADLAPDTVYEKPKVEEPKSYARGAGTIPSACPPDKPDYNAGLCYPVCKEGYKAVGPVCWQKTCPGGYTDDGATCRKDADIFSKGSYGRGVGTVPNACPSGKKKVLALCYPGSTVPNVCPSGKENDAGLCYPVCQAGYKGVGPVCWQTCPAGYTDDGATCRKDAHIFGKDSYGRGAGVVPEACPSGMEYDAGLCYPVCQAGYKGVGPVCWETTQGSSSSQQSGQQNNWRWCNKCQGLFYGGPDSSMGVCPAGGNHDLKGSGDYVLAYGITPSSGQQNNWRWCNKCQGLFYGGPGSSMGVCPAGGSHDLKGSGDYVLTHNGS